jgi:hypothetical protein
MTATVTSLQPTEQLNDANDGNDAKLKEIYVQKHTNGSLAEAVIVNGLPFFLEVSDFTANLKERIETPSMVLLPLDKTGYLNKEYEFRSLTEVQDYINRARDESIDSLYEKVKSIFAKYIDADNDHLTICAADTIFTYFQDKIGQTHYLMFVGDNGTGKSNNLVVFQYLGYRPLFDTSITPANIYSYLGSVEEGQGIILEDEADNIDSNLEKMKIYKVGYNAGKKVSRMDLTFGRKQQSYWTYCFKAYTAEREPDKDKAKGFLERTFVIHCSPGSPKYDISEVINPAGDEKYQQLLDELQDTRKLLLIYRMLHFGEPILDIGLNVQNREKQLCKPLLRLFQNAECRTEISNTLVKLLAEKRERKSNTLEAKLYRIVSRLVKECGLALTPSNIWNTTREELEGEEVAGKSQSCYTTEHGMISQRQVVNILVDKFHAKRKRDEKNRLLIFDQGILDRLQNVYEIAETIEIVKADTHDANDAFSDGIDSYESNPENPDALKKASEASSPSGSAIGCPYCPDIFETEDEILTHGILVHPGKPIASDLSKGGVTE